MTQAPVTSNRVNGDIIDTTRSTQGEGLHRASRSNIPRWVGRLVICSWLLIGLQTMALTGNLIQGHVRNRYVDSLLWEPDPVNAAGMLAYAVGASLPAIVAFIAAVSACRADRARQAMRAELVSGALIGLNVLLLFMPTSARATSRDLSTPSSRLVGHWVEPSHGSSVYYTPQLSNASMGRFSTGRQHSGTYQILYEDASGTEIVLKRVAPILAFPSGESVPGTSAEVILHLCISRDGRVTHLLDSVVICEDGRQVHTGNGGTYRYADARTQP